MRVPGLDLAAAGLRTTVRAGQGALDLTAAELSRRKSTAPALRSFDPRRVGELEAATWSAYYRREWARVLPLSLRLVREVFELPWPSTVRGGMMVAQATRAWAPIADNAPETARERMQAFYALVVQAHGEPPDPAEAARLEVNWWRVHRELASAGATDKTPLVEALATKYAHVYQVEATATTKAAELRTAAMDLSDEWVRGDVRGEREPEAVTNTLIESYDALAHAVR